MTVSQQDDASLTELSFGQLVKDFNGKANIVKLWVAGFPPMEPSGGLPDAAGSKIRGLKSWSRSAPCHPMCRATLPTRWGAILAKYPKGKIDAIWGTWDAFSQGAYKALKENGRTEIQTLQH